MVDFYSKNKWVGVITSVLLIANIITLTMLWVERKNPTGNKPLPPHGGAAFEFVVKELAMTEQQQNAYKALRDEHKQQVKPLTDSLISARNTFFSLLKDTSLSEGRLTEYSAAVVKWQEKIELVNFKHFQKIKAICTHAQMEKFDNIMEEVLKRFANRRPPLQDGRSHPGREEGPPPAP